MLISIIIPIYNVEKYIEECLESVYQQTYPNIEVILVNDCTPDNSMAIANALASKYQNKISTKIINHPYNMGLSEARNSGIKKASGEYIYFVDSDDAIMPYSIELLANVAIKYSNIDAIEGKMINSSNYFTLEMPPLFPISEPIIYMKDDSKRLFLVEDKNPFVWNILYRKTFITQNSLFFQTGMIYEDAFFRIKATQHLSSMAILPVITYFYRYNASSLSHKASTKHLLSIKEILHHLNGILTKNIHPKNIYFSCFCKNAFLYWNKPCRMTNEHKVFFKTIKKIVKNTIYNHYKHLGIVDLCLISPFYMPYGIAKCYVKIIWKYLF